MPIKTQQHLGTVLWSRLCRECRDSQHSGRGPPHPLSRPLPATLSPGVARIVGSCPKCHGGYALINRAKFQRPVRFDPTGGSGWEWTAAGGMPGQDAHCELRAATRSHAQPGGGMLAGDLSARAAVSNPGHKSRF